MNEQKLIKDLGIRLEEKSIELAERDAEIIRLRAAVDLRDKTICANQTERNANAVKSAEKTKQIVMLREALETYREYTPEGTGVAEQALAATDDLKDCILCDANPVAWLDFHSRNEEPLSIGFDEPECIKSFDTDVVWKEPLYKARKP